MSKKKPKTQYYYSTEADGTTYGGFRPFDSGDVAVAPDWNPNPRIECGQGLHVVTGHPLRSHEFVKRANPVYYEVQPRELVPALTGRKYRCHSLRRLRRLRRNSPEWSLDRLGKMAQGDAGGYVRRAAVGRLEDQKLLGKIAQEDVDPYVREVAIKRLEELQCAKEARR